MSLFTSLQLAGNSLQASQIGLQVVGNNIANANTPGYIRQSVEFTPAPTQLVGTLPLGLGVRVQAIVQEVDKFLQERLRHAGSDLANGRAQEEAYSQLEAIVGELSDTDLSTSLSDFFGSIQDVLNQPEDVAVRNLAVLRAETLTGSLQRLASRVRTVQQDANQRVIATAEDINRLIEEIADLNVKIAEIEAGSTSHSDAVGLRDQREIALKNLSEIIDISTAEQRNGSITVYVGGDFLVFEGNTRDVSAVVESNSAYGKGEIRLSATDKPLPLASGRLAGLVAARDDIFGGFLDQLDTFSATLIQEFNRIYASGQGLVGHDQLTSEFTVSDATLALDQAGLRFSPVNGSLQVQVFNTQTGLTQTTDVLVKLNGLDDDTSLESLQQALDAIDGVSARLTSSRGLVIEADSPVVQFAFANDTSGVLTALGVGGFFTGTSAGDIGVSRVVKTNPAKFAASRGGIGADTDNAVELAGFLDRALDSGGGTSLATLYDRMIADTTQGAAVAKAVAEGFEVFQQTLEAQNLAISGVSIDEEAVRMIQYQRAFQASAKFLSTVSDLLDLLVNL
jgi:flagellar hook-associated protein 1 FlgK